jgi:hypothetical protein
LHCKVTRFAKSTAGIGNTVVSVGTKHGCRLLFSRHLLRRPEALGFPHEKMLIGDSLPPNANGVCAKPTLTTG